MDGVDIAPFRSLDEFLMSSSRFQVPDFNDPGKWGNRIVSNLLYYQTNYFLSAVVIFLLITFLNPGEMILGIITMASIFGVLYYLSFNQLPVKNFKKAHPMVVMISTFCVGYFLIYQIGCVIAFLLGVMMPVVFIVAHASLRLRNIKNKVTSVAENLGVSRKTPMAVFLDEWGIEPEVKYIN